MKKIMALMVGLLILGAAFAAAQEATQTQAQERAKAQARIEAQAQAQAKAQAKSEFRLRNRIAFVDEDGDGLNDLARDSDGDGIPNCQDPDWVKPADGAGYAAQHRIGKPGETGMTQGRKSGFGKGSFRSGGSSAAKGSGTGVCDGAGPKGTAQRKGRR